MDERKAKGVSTARTALATHLMDLTYGEAHDLGRLMEDLTAHPGWERLTALLDRHYATIITRFVHGSARQHADYISDSGELTGLEMARWAADGIIDFASEAQAEQERLAEEAAANG